MRHRIGLRGRIAVAATAVSAGLAATGAPLAAQAPGWVGISFEVRRASSQPGEAATVVITDVLEGSPAAEAGLRPGDALLSINDVQGPEELGTLLGRIRLLEGDPVRIRIERDGWERELRLRAAARPTDVSVSSSTTFRFEPDSVVETMVRAMDEFRERLAHSRGGRLRVQADPESGTLRVTTTDGVPGALQAAEAPFEFFVFQGEAHDSLRREMDALNRRLARLAEREESRLHELRRSAPADWARLAERDDVLAELRTERQEATLRSLRLRAAMADAARVSAGLAYAPRAGTGEASAGATLHHEEFRPLTPYLLGRNRVAGAEVVDLRPELAEYFGVEAGVLVVDVPDLTPAHAAGLRPGDVVTRLGREPVRSVEDLRRAVSRVGASVPVTLIRQGTSRELLLRW